MENKRMDNKICAIIGAGPDLGLALAKRFGREGFLIIFISRRPEARKGYVTILQDEGMKALAVAADPMDRESIKHAFGLIKKQLGTPEVLIYNATTRGARPVPSVLDIESLISDFRVNVAGALVSAQQVIPDMRSRHRGTIFLTAGGYGSHSESPFMNLAIGWASIRVLCSSLGIELEPSGIHVATVLVNGIIQRGGRFDPDRIAEDYWKLYRREPRYEGHEVVFDEIFEQHVRSIRKK